MVPPSTIIHLDNIVAVLRRSPASVEHHHRHHAVVLAELSLDTRLDRISRDVIKLYVCKNSEVPCFRCLINRAVKMYNYINHVVLTLPLSVYEGRGQHSPLLLLCITMILHVRRIFFKLLRSPTVASEPYQHVILWFSGIVR